MDKFIFGVHPIMEAIKNGLEINKIFIRKGLKNDAIIALTTMAKPLNIPIQYIPLERFNKYTRKNHQGVLAIVSPIEYQPWEEILHRCFAEGRDPLFVILDGITDVRNFGAIARTAECAAADCIIISTTNNPGVTADAMKTSAGALNNIPICRVKNLSETIENIKNSGLYIVACTSSKDTIYTNIDFKKPLAIIVGAEDKGIDIANIKIADQKIGIPILGTLDSLNVSVATGIVIYEVLRQRNLLKTQ